MESGGFLPRPVPCVGSESEPADGRGGWRAARFLLAVGFLERVGFYGVQANLIMYLNGPLGMSTAAAASSVNAWAGTVQVLPLVGALAADSRLGRYKAVLTAVVLYLLSLGMLTVSSTLQTPQPHAGSSPSPSSTRLALFYFALYMLALAQGFHRPCAEALGADQFATTTSEADCYLSAPAASRSSYFNWFHFSLSCGYAIANAGLSYVEDNVGWTVGFAACWATMVLYLAVFLLGTPTYRAEKPGSSRSFTEIALDWAARVTRHKDDATDTTERLVPPEREEDSKGLVAKLLPIWVTSLVFAAIYSQNYTLFTKQSSTLDRRLGGSTGPVVVVPPAALEAIVSVTIIAVLPVYDRVLVPLARRFTWHHAGVTPLQRIGAGIAMSGVAMVVAAVVEVRRLRVARDAGLVDRPDVALPMSLWWVVPQYVMIGVSIVLAEVGLEEFFYDQVPHAMRSVGLALSLSVMGAGSYASSVLVWVIDWATTNWGAESWFSDNLNRAHLDYFYWLLAGLAALGVAAFLRFASRYVYKKV